MNRTVRGALSAVALLAGSAMSGCNSETEAPKAAAKPAAQQSLYGANAPVYQAGSGATAQTDIQTLQAGRAQDQNVINEANKAVGVVGADPLRH